MARSERARWGLCFAVLGAMVAAGGAVTTTSRTAHAQQPAQTPEQIFNRVCSRCHGAGGNAPEEDTPAIANKRLTEARMRQIIRNGKDEMRAIPVSRLSDADLTTLMTYLRQIRAVR